MKRSLPVALVVVVSLAVGILLGGHPNLLPGFISGALVSEEVRTQQQVQQTIRDNFFHRVSDRKLENGSLNGMVKSLHDRFSSYLDQRHYNLYTESANGSYSGVGMAVNENKLGLEVAGTYKGSPARKAGIEQGDIILAANGKSLKGQPLGLAVARIKGKPGTNVVLKVKRKGKGVKTYRLKRTVIKVPLVYSKVIRRDGEKYGLVGLVEFSRGAHSQLADEVEKLKKRGIKGVALDLRGNPGGLLTEAVAVASLFIERGVVVVTRGRNSPREVYDAAGDAILPRLPMAVLVNRYSASASEIVAGALKDHERAVVVGGRTFGKGVFQNIYSLDNGGGLVLTAGHYFTPDGTDLGGKGLVPNVKVDQKASDRRDRALDAAIKKLDGK